MVNIQKKMKDKLKQAIRKNKKLYVILRVLKELSSERLYKLIWGYYEYSPDFSSEIIEHRGNKHPDEIVLYFPHGEHVTECDGFFAAMNRTLVNLYYAEYCGFKPMIQWGKYSPYYDPEMNDVTKNIFEYYYESAPFTQSADALQCKNIIMATRTQIRKAAGTIGEEDISYNESDKKFELLADVYKKHCHLNKRTKDFIDSGIEKTIGDKRTLGVHVRGTDFRIQVIYHPIIISPEEFLQKAKEQLATGKYEQVFLATDDLDALEIFKKEIPKDQLVYYPDVQRGTGYTAAFEMENTRPFHKYKLGLEVLRDVYTLANCDGLLAGRSMVSFAARYIALSLDKYFSDCIIIYKGLRQTNSRAAKIRKKNLRKKERLAEIEQKNK